MDDWKDIVKPDMLCRRITLDEYFVEHADWVRRGLITQAAVDANRANLESLARPGDQWWTWVIGTQPLMQMGGLALVRNGNIEWARDDWIS